MKKKEVKIKQITSVFFRGIKTHTNNKWLVFGLGEDNKVYWWDTSKLKWELDYEEDELMSQN